MAEHILVVEDDMYIRELIEEFLKAQGYKVTTAVDGLEGYQAFVSGVFDLVILDIMMPNMDGYALCKMLRQKSDVSIIMLTALNDEKDQVKAFELEADDYITKPFSFTILVKRVEAALRRGRKSTCSKTYVLEELRLDCEAYKVYVSDRLIDITAKEFDILQLMLENKGRTLTREQLLDRIWGYDYYGDPRIVDAHIKNIRRKLGVPYIKTVKGIGYEMDA